MSVNRFFGKIVIHTILVKDFRRSLFTNQENSLIQYIYVLLLYDYVHSGWKALLYNYACIAGDKVRPSAVKRRITFEENGADVKFI